MTCAVALVHDDGKISIGVDSAATAGQSLDLVGVDNNKVFRKKAGDGLCLIAASGKARFLQILECHVDLPALPNSRDQKAMMRWVVVSVIDAVRLKLKEQGMMTTKDGFDEAPGSFLLGVCGRLYEIDGGLFVKAIIDTYAAIGSGATEARGALFAITKLKIRCNPETAIRTALKAAERFTPTVRAPFKIIHL